VEKLIWKKYLSSKKEIVQLRIARIFPDAPAATRLLTKMNEPQTLPTSGQTSDFLPAGLGY
jgi:hypothetical protein